MNSKSPSVVASAISIAFAAAALSTAAVGQVSVGNISQSQSGGTNKQSISIGNTDAKPKKGKKVESAQKDAETGNTQSGSVSGGAKLNQNQAGRDNTQTADVNASGGNISQSQSGRGNSQSISIGSGTKVTGTPSITQSQTGADGKKSTKVDGKKVE